MIESYMKHTLYQDETLQVEQWTGCPFRLEDLPACWPRPQLPPPLDPDAELSEAVRSSTGKVIAIYHYFAFGGKWEMMAVELPDMSPWDNVILFPGTK